MEIPAQMVVLSACETGIGKEFPGEGIFSMARGFAYAGCPSIIMSLWRVNDEFTAKLMDDFYKNLKDGSGIPEAIRIAKMSFLDESSSFRAFPYYWSGFVSLGDPSPVRESGKWQYLFWIIPMIVVLGYLYLRMQK